MGHSKRQAEMMLGKGYVSVQMLAERSGKHTGTIYRQIRDGKLSSVKVTGTVYVPIAAAIEYIGPDGARILGIVAPGAAAPTGTDGGQGGGS